MFAMRVTGILILLFHPLFSQNESLEAPLPAAPVPESELVAEAPKTLLSSTSPSSDGYTINYNTVSILEYLRFASKICKVNFIYDEADLNFTITVVSDEPVTPSNVMATLLQVLRIHGLFLLEQDNNLVIHKSTTVKQVATLVAEGQPEGNAPIVTRIFRVKNAKPESIAAIIGPMISSSAQLETSAETRQIILTDIRANVDKIAALIENLDSPHTLLEIHSFPVKHNKPDFLIELASQIMNPIASGNPFILVPQNLANEIFIVSTPELIDKTLSVLTNLDTPPKVDASMLKKIKPENVFVYQALNRSGKELLKSLQNIASNLQTSGAADPDLIQTIDGAKWIPDTNSLMFMGSKESLDKTKEFLSALDVSGGAGKSGEKNSFFVYKPQFRTADQIEKSILELANNLKGTKGADPVLIETIESVKINPMTHTLSFSGEEKTFDQIKQLLATIDTSSGKASGPVIPPSTQFFIYKPTHQTGEELSASLKEVTSELKSDKLADPALLNALESMKWVKSTHSILFTGDPASLQKIQSLITSFDVAPSKPTQKTFYLYRPIYGSEDRTESYLKQVAQNLSKKGGSESLIESIRSYKWIPESQSFMFYGNSSDLDQVKDLLATFDVPNLATRKPEASFFQYHPKYASEETTENYLKQVSQSLAKKGSSESLVETLKSYKWIPDSRTFMFHGNEADLTRVKELLGSFDTPEAETKPSYYIYKVQHTSGDLIEEDLDSLAKNFKSSGLKDAKILNVIEHIRYVKQTNSLLLSGDPQAIEEVKHLIAQYDYPRTAAAPSSSNFYIYKPQHTPPPQIEKSLREIATNLKNAGLADPSLLKSLDTVKYVDTTNSLIFTGPPETLQKIPALIADIDIPPAAHAPIQHVGKTTFLLYKLKNASGPQIVSSLKNMTSELKKSGSSDKDFIAALNSIKYIKETNSLFFSGTEDSLLKVQSLVEKFDVTSLSAKPEITAQSTATGPSNFFVYKTQSLAGPDLEKLLGDFAEHLSSSGLNDPDLFAAIRSMRWTEKTQTLVFTGTPKALDQIKELLKEFDIPSNLPAGPAIAGPLEPSIQAIDNTSFLVYKLQFHKGDEIQGALRQIAKDLIISNAPVNQGLLNSINSIQWLEVTNSLLCSGDQETLTRLRELIKNLDIPLKQVFIEMLMIETTLANAMTFGLEWGANFKYRDKFSTNSYNVLPGTQPDQYITNLSNLAAPTTPTPNLIPPPSSGFDLGVIGEVIRHNGQTFLTLGSLLSALQTDDETSIIMTPKIITQDGRTSTLFRGENIPFVGSFISNSGSNTINTSNIEYRDIGVNLTVTPVLGNSDIITLDINLDRSQTVGDITQQSLQPGAQTANGIITSKTTMQTTVHVPDNHFLVLTGMVNNSNVKSKAGIPCLGGLPLVGALFSKNADAMTNSNIVIFIRPHIINSIEDMRKVSAKEEEFFRDQVGTPFLERNFDEGMELIKTVDDE